MRPPHVAIAGDAAMVFAMAASLDRSCRPRLTLIPADPGAPAETPAPRDGIRIARAAEPADIFDAVVFCAPPGAPRGELAALMGDVGSRAAAACPRTVLIVAAEDSLALAQRAARVTRLDPSLVLATGGMPRVERERARLAARHDVDPSQVQAVVIGADEPSSVRLVHRYTSVAGIPTDMLGDPDRRGAEPAGGGAAAGALARAGAALARAVVQDRRAVFCCGARIGDALGIPGGWIAAPVRVGAAGALEPIPLRLTVEERSFLMSAARLPADGA